MAEQVEEHSEDVGYHGLKSSSQLTEAGTNSFTGSTNPLRNEGDPYEIASQCIKAAMRRSKKLNEPHQEEHGFCEPVLLSTEAWNGNSKDKKLNKDSLDMDNDLSMEEDGHEVEGNDFKMEDLRIGSGDVNYCNDIEGVSSDGEKEAEGVESEEDDEQDRSHVVNEQSTMTAHELQEGFRVAASTPSMMEKRDEELSGDCSGGKWSSQCSTDSDEGWGGPCHPASLLIETGTSSCGGTTKTQEYKGNPYDPYDIAAHCLEIALNRSKKIDEQRKDHQGLFEPVRNSTEADGGSSTNKNPNEGFLDKENNFVMKKDVDDVDLNDFKKVDSGVRGGDEESGNDDEVLGSSEDEEVGTSSTADTTNTQRYYGNPYDIAAQCLENALNRSKKLKKSLKYEHGILEPVFSPEARDGNSKNQQLNRGDVAAGVSPTLMPTAAKPIPAQSAARWGGKSDSFWQRVAGSSAFQACESEAEVPLQRHERQRSAAAVNGPVATGGSSLHVEPDSNGPLRGEVVCVHMDGGELRSPRGELMTFSSERCFLHGVELPGFDLSLIFRVGMQLSYTEEGEEQQDSPPAPPEGERNLPKAVCVREGERLMGKELASAVRLWCDRNLIRGTGRRRLMFLVERSWHLMAPEVDDNNLREIVVISANDASD